MKLASGARSMSWLQRRCSPSSQAPLLVSEILEHLAGIGRRLKTQEGIDESTDLPRDR